MKEYTEDQMTPWFDAEVKPLHVGAYQRGFSNQMKEYRFWYWNGDFWEVGSWDTAELAAKYPRGQTSQYGLSWRGLLARPATNDKE